MASVNPNDRDRGLRLVGTATSAVAAVTLVAIGATTALAAGETKQQDELKFVSAKPGGEPVVPLTIATTGPPSTTDGVATERAATPTAKPTTHRPKPTLPPKPAPTGVPVAPTTSKASAPKPTTKAATAPSTTTSKPKPKPTTPSSTTSTTEPAPDPTTPTPTVSSTAS